MPSALLVILTFGLYNFGGLHSPAAAAYLVIIVLAVLLLGGRGAIVFALLSILAALGVLYAEAAGGIVVSQADSGLRAWTIYTALYILGALLLYLAARSIREGLDTARQLRAAEVARTRDLDAHLAIERKRVRQLELLAAIAGHLTGLKEAQTLMDEVVRRLHEDFGFQHISILLVEERELVERATYGAFSHLIPPGERVALGDGIIGWVGLTGQSYLTNDTAADEHFTSLPGAHVNAELAVPLRLGKNVVGVLNVESEMAGAFDAADISTLETLADLLSAAMQSSQLFAEVRARQRLAEALRRAGAAVTASLDLPTVLEAICAETCAAFDTDGAVVWLLEGEELRAVAARGPGAEPVLGLRCSVADPNFLSARAVCERQPVFVNDLQRSAQGIPEFKSLTGAQALLATPIVRDGQPLGALAVVDTRDPQRFGPHDVNAAELLGAQAAVAIQNARLFEESRRKTQEPAGLNDTALAVSGVLETRTLLTRLHQQVQRLMSPEAFGVILYEADSDELEWALAMEADEPLAAAAGRRVPLHEGGLTGWVIRTRQPLLIGDLQVDSLPVEPKYLTRPAGAWLGVPLLARDQVIGAVTVQSFHAGGFDDGDRRFLESLGGQIAIALENARLYEDSRRHAEQMTRLNDITRAALETRDFHSMLQTLASRLCALFHADGCYLARWDSARQATIPTATYGPGREVYLGIKFEPEEATMTRAVARAGHPLVAEDVFDSPYTSARIAALLPDRSLLGLPLVTDGETIGAALVGFNRPHRFTQGEIALGQQAAGQIALALVKARALEAERDQRRLAEALRQAGATLGEGGAPQELDTFRSRNCGLGWR